MNRHDMGSMPREPTKRVILYPLQDTVNQQHVNGLYQRAKTELLINNHTETIAQSINNGRATRQQPLSSLPNGTSTALNEKSSDDGTLPASLGHSTALPPNQRSQNPYYSNPFFRPRVIANQQSGTATSVTSASSSATTDVTFAPIVPTSTVLNRGKPPLYPHVQNPLLFAHGKPPDANAAAAAALTSPSQDDSRPWAQPAVSTHIVRCNVNGERSNGLIKPSEITATNNDTAKQRGSSATDIVISLMDTSTVSHNSASTSTTNPPARSNGHIFSSNEQIPSTPPFSLGDISSAASSNNQNWKKALVANFQKNHRSIPTAKLLYGKPPAAPLQASAPPQATTPRRPITPIQNAAPPTSEIVHQAPPPKSKPPAALNASVNERSTPADENTAPVPNSARRSSESLLITKEEANTIERSASLQIPKFPYALLAATTNASSTPYTPVSVPSSFLPTKPTASIEQQQRANITRVMIRRDFVKPLESKPPMPAAAIVRPMPLAQSTKTETASANNVIRVATIAESPNRAYLSQQQQTVHLSQKSLLSHPGSNTATKEATRTDNTQQKSNRASTNAGDCASSTRSRPSQPNTSHMTMSSDEAKRRRREEIESLTKRRAASASATSDYETMDKDPFEMEDEEYEAETEDESVRDSESDADAENTVTLDATLLLSDKTRRVGNTEVKPGFSKSLFDNVPPTIRFCTETQRIEPLPMPLQRMMKWKMSAITPNIVKSTVLRSGFRLISGDEGTDWLGTWSRHMKPVCFKAIREYQKINHFPGSFQIGRKDRLWRNLSHMQAVHSRREFDFVPQTFVLPADFLLFKRVFDETADSKESKWIIKPPASARGQGIRVISKMDQVPKKRAVVVQKYIANPYLINAHKFDMRLYVYVPSHDPLRIYLFDDGLARFASRKYSSSLKSLSDRFMHLTNYSVNRYNSEYRTNSDSAACTGHKWSLKALWAYLKKRDIDVADVIERIKDLVIKTIISADAFVNVLTKANVRRKYSVHELFGFDVILDENCKPYIVEVNISPSLHSNSPLDISVKGAMICDLLNLSGFMIPDRRDIVSDGGARKKAKLPKSLIFDRRVLPQSLSTDEKVKHQYFSQRYNDEQVRKNILDVLTPDDLRILIETEDEFARRGSFERIFPTNQTRKYLKYFETPRYYNLLLNEWITKYTRNEQRGIALLNSCCKKEVHVQNPTTDANHLWAPHQKNQGHMSHRENDNGNGS